jgi:hypothetical protein
MAKKTYLWPDGKQHSIPYTQHQTNVKKNTADAGKHSLSYRLKKVPGLLAKYRSDPGLRSKLPNQYLTPGQLASRKHNQFLAGISNPAGTLAGPDLVNAAQQITNSEFDPLLKDISSQQDLSSRNQAAVAGAGKGYATGLNNLFGSIIGSQDAANTAAVQGAQQRAAATQGQIGAADQAAQAALAHDAAVRGADLQAGGAANQAARTAEQQAQAAQEAQRAQQAASDTGSAQAAFLRGLQGAAAQQAGEFQGQVANQGAQQQASLTAQRNKLNSQKVGQFTDTLLKLRQQEADNLFTKAGLNLDQAKLDAAAQPSVQDQKTQAELDFFKKHGYWPATGPPKPKSDQGYGAGKTGMNKYGFTYDEWNKLSPKKQNDYRTGKATRAPKGSKGGGNKNGSDTGDVAKAQDAYGAAVAAAKAAHIPLDKAHRNQLTQYLMTEAPESSVNVSQKDKQGRTISQKVVQRPAHKAQPALWASIAADILIDGHVSRYNAKRLHDRGLTVDDLGLTSYTQYQQQQAKQSAATKNHFGPNG